MKDGIGLVAEITADLGLDRMSVKGLDRPVRNCWHFYTSGDSSDAVFYDEEDFLNGMNRIPVVAVDYDIAILAFVLMDTHVHFILYGSLDSCKRFVHEYIRRTSQYISLRYSERGKLRAIEIGHQAIDDDRYLKTAICYVIKNPPSAGLRYNAWDYPWSSGSLYFRAPEVWTSPKWISGAGMRPADLTEKRKKIRTRTKNLGQEFIFLDKLIFPGQYVAVSAVESLFRSHRGFNYFMCISKDTDIESRGGSISHLAIPMQEMRQHRTDLCRELFGGPGLRNLDTSQRLRLARTLKSRYDSSPKQVVRLCGLVYDEVKDLL